MVYSGKKSYGYIMIEGTKGAADPTSDQNIPLNPMETLVPQKPKYVDEEIRTFDSLVPKVVYTKEKAPGEGPLESYFVDPFLLLAFFTHKTVGGTWVTGTGTITADFTDDDEDTLGLQYHGHDQSAAVAHIEKLLKYGLPQKYGWKVEPGKLLKEIAEVKFLDFSTNTQAMSCSNAFHDQAFGSGIGGWANWDKSGLGALAEIFTVLVTKTQAEITTGWYFLFTDGTTEFYVWMDKNGDGSTDDPGPIGTKTGVACNISGATTAAEVATAIKTAIDALSIVSASVVSETVTVTNDHLGNYTDAVDNNTTFTITVTQQGVTSGFRSVADMVLKWGGSELTALSIKTMDWSFELPRDSEQIYSSLTHAVDYKAVRNFMCTITGIMSGLQAVTEVEKLYSARLKQTLQLYYDKTVDEEKYLQFTNAYFSPESDNVPIPEAGKPVEVTLIFKGGAETAASFSGKWLKHVDPTALLTTSP